MLPKGPLTSHSRMSGSRWVITPLWLSGSWRSFLYSSSVYCCHPFLLSSASFRSIPFLSFIVPIFARNIPLLSLIFLKRSLVFPILLFSSVSLHWSLRKAFLSLLAVLWNSAFKCVYLSFSPLPFASLLFSAICKASSDNHSAFLHFFLLQMILITASYTMSQSFVHSSLGILSDLIPGISLSLPLYNQTGKFWRDGNNWPPDLPPEKSLWQDKKQQLELDMEQHTGSKLGKEYIKAVYCHPAYLSYMQSTSREMPDWMKQKLESRFPGEISITSDMQLTPPLWQKVKKN